MGTMGRAVEASGSVLWIGAAALAVLLGGAAQLQQTGLWPWSRYVVFAAVAASSLVLAATVGRGSRWARLVTVLALFGLAFATAGWRAQARLAERLDPALEGRDLVVTGIVAQMPRRLADGVRFTFDVERATTMQGGVVAIPTRISLGWYRGGQEEAALLAPYDKLAAGQRWRLAVRLKQPHGTLNPHGFDLELWMFEQGLGAAGYVRVERRGDAELMGERAGVPLERWRQAVRDAIDAKVRDERAAGVLAALAVGDQAAIERSDWDLFRATGIAHLVSISGLHITMFAWLAAAMVGALWRRSERATLWCPAPVAARWGGLGAAALYALLAGWGVPAQRTVWMLATAALLAQFGVRWPWPLVLLVVAAVVTLVDPWALLQPGFWLSFVAVGLLLVAEPAKHGAGSATRLRAVARSMRHGVRTQVIATLGLAPLTLVFFQQVSLVGFVANLLAIPLITLLITPMSLLGVLVPPLWQLGAVLLQGLTQVLGLLAALPGAVWTAAVAPWGVQAGALLGAALLVMPLPWRLRALALPLALPLFAPAVGHPPEGAMQVTVADVGQGSAILVRTRGHALLHDAGAQFSRESDAGARVLLPLLRALGVGRVDLLMLSHRDNDHVGGAPALIAGLPVAAISSSLEPDHPLRATAVPHQRCEAGQSWRWDGVEFRVLHPWSEDYVRAAPRPNTLSCTLAVTDAQGRQLLLTGDLEAEQEARLVHTPGAALSSEVLIVPHHGSKTSSTPAFIDAVAPRFAVVQAGYRNRFGHPAPEVAQRYVARGVALVRSDRCGAWTWAPGEPPRCERDASRRYWHHRTGGDDGAELAGVAARP
ncbi:MAG: DNA internalization-related competence protein ComEC/Rec2 [Aquincola sp.]|nr:DNA internalization-related competence protein ComEC/Rec2 [Aquincola sp.]